MIKDEFLCLLFLWRFCNVLHGFGTALKPASTKVIESVEVL